MSREATLQQVKWARRWPRAGPRGGPEACCGRPECLTTLGGRRTKAILRRALTMRHVNWTPRWPRAGPRGGPVALQNA